MKSWLQWKIGFNYFTTGWIPGIYKQCRQSYAKCQGPDSFSASADGLLHGPGSNFCHPPAHGVEYVEKNPLYLFLASQDALEVIVWVSESHCWTELTDVTLVSEDTYWGLYWETLIFNDTYGGDVREIVVLIMEVDKVVDEVTDMEIDK